MPKMPDLSTERNINLMPVQSQVMLRMSLMMMMRMMALVPPRRRKKIWIQLQVSQIYSLLTIKTVFGILTHIYPFIPNHLQDHSLSIPNHLQNQCILAVFQYFKHLQIHCIFPYYKNCGTTIDQHYFQTILSLHSKGPLYISFHSKISSEP